MGLLVFVCLFCSVRIRFALLMPDMLHVRVSLHGDYRGLFFVCLVTFADCSGLDLRGSIRALYSLRTYLGLPSVLLRDFVCNFGITPFDLALSLNMKKHFII